MLPPEKIPDDINLFAFDHEKYPLLHQIYEEGYILAATLSPGDCLYIPAQYYAQSRTMSH